MIIGSTSSPSIFAFVSLGVGGIRASLKPIRLHLNGMISVWREVCRITLNDSIWNGYNIHYIERITQNDISRHRTTSYDILSKQAQWVIMNF